ncbi:MAG: N-acetyltransferase family protein [Spirochaetota bacterium]
MNLEYRPIEQGDKRALRRLAARAFGPATGFMVSPEQGGHVALDGGRVVGATVLKVFTAGSRRIGLVDFIMVDPAAQSQGIASRLNELAHAWFAEREADALLALVEGYNQSSSKLFQSRGYRRLTLAEQLRVFGAGTLRVWLASFYVVAVGSFLWYREAGADADRPAPDPERTRPSSLAGVGAAVLINAFCMSLVYLAGGLPWTVPLAPAAIVGIPAVLIGVRTLVMALVARARGLEVRFDAWTGGLPLGLVVGAIGGYVPLPGNVYPRARSYRYRDVLPAIGPASFAAGFALVLLHVALMVVDLPLSAPAWGEPLRGFALSVIFPVILVDLLLPSFPLWGYLGRQVWNWSCVAWGAIAVAAVGSIVLRFVLG